MADNIPKLEDVKGYPDGKKGQDKLNKDFENAATAASDKAVKEYKAGQAYNQPVGSAIGSGDIVPAITMLAGLPFGLGKIAQSFSDILNNVTAALNPVDNTINAIKAVLVPEAGKFFETIKREYGNIEGLTQESANQTVRNIQKSRENIDKIYAMSAKELREAGLDEYIVDIKMPGGIIEEMNMFQASMENLGEAYDKFIYSMTQDEVMGDLLANQMVGLEGEMLRLSEGLNLSTEESMSFIKRQMNMTGQAGTDGLEELATFSVAVEKATGISYKKIAKTSAKIRADVETFGDVTAEQAAKIAGSLRKAGISFETFSGLIGNLQSFESATSMMSNLATGFGINIDAMDLMAKSFEDPQAAMYDLRDAFMDAGLSIEDMGQHQKKFLAQSLNMEIPEIERFFGEGFLPDQDLLDEAAADADPEEAIEKIRAGISTLIDEGGNAKQVAAKAIEEIIKIPMANELFDLSKDLAGMGAAYREEIIEANKLISSGVEDFFLDESDPNSVVNKINQAVAGGGDIAKAISGIFVSPEFKSGIVSSISVGLKEFNKKFGVQGASLDGLTKNQENIIKIMEIMTGTKATNQSFVNLSSNAQQMINDLQTALLDGNLQDVMDSLKDALKALTSEISKSSLGSSPTPAPAPLPIAINVNMKGGSSLIDTIVAENNKPGVGVRLVTTATNAVV